MPDSEERIWRLPLEGPAQRMRFLAAGLVLVLLYWGFAAGDYASKVLAASLAPERLGLATKIQPLNAAFHHLLGRVAFYDHQDFPSALVHYRRATELDRYSARYWLDLANTQEIMSLATDSRYSLQQALAADPTNPEVANEAANYYLVLGDTDTALKLLSMVVRYSPEQARSAVELSWRATQDANAVMNQVLPRNADSYFMLLKILMERQQIDAATQVWEGLMGLKEPIPAEATFPYIDYLLQQGEVARAQSAWNQFMRRGEGTRGYQAEGNLVTNGGFEEDILNGGFGWRYQSDPRIGLAIDERDSYRGRRSLSITFSGDAIQDAGIWQLLPVQPDTEYRISARVKTEAMEGAGGPQLAVLDSHTRQPLFLSAEFSGTQSWQAVEGEFRTASDSHLLMVRVVRVPGSTRIRGRFWLDEVSVVTK